LDRILGVLEEIGRLFVGERVGHAGKDSTKLGRDTKTKKERRWGAPLEFKRGLNG
jgi:hypothetical protein